MNLVTRRAIGADVERLFVVRTAVHENHLSREELARKGITHESLELTLLDPNHSSWVSQTDDGTIVGFCIADLLEGYVFALFVLPSFHGRGIGRSLISSIEQDARSFGKASLWLSTGAEPDSRAHGFYLHLGWNTDGFLPDGQVVFRKRL